MTSYHLSYPKKVILEQTFEKDEDRDKAYFESHYSLKRGDGEYEKWF